MFLRNANFPIHWEELVKAISLIERSGRVEVVIKHHTRDKKMAPILAAHPLLATGSDSVAIAGDDRSSPSLLNWADLVVDIGTSIAFEAILLGKPVLELEHVHPNRSTVAEYLPATEIRTRDELVAALRCAHADLESIRPTKAEIGDFMSAIVEPAGPGVLDRYAALLASAAPTLR